MTNAGADLQRLARESAVTNMHAANLALVFAPNLLRFDPATVDSSDPMAQMKALKDAGLAPNFVERCLLMDLEAFGAAVAEVQL